MPNRNKLSGSGVGEAGEIAAEFILAADVLTFRALLAVEPPGLELAGREALGELDLRHLLVIGVPRREVAIEQAAAFVVLAGDLYDHDRPNMQIAVFLRNQLTRLKEKGIRVVTIKGNLYEAPGGQKVLAIVDVEPQK